MGHCLNLELSYSCHSEQCHPEQCQPEFIEGLSKDCFRIFIILSFNLSYLILSFIHDANTIIFLFILGLTRFSIITPWSVERSRSGALLKAGLN